MSKSYKIYEVDHKTSARGTAYKKLVLQGKDDQHPTKNVTMFSDHPLFEDIAEGQTHDLDIHVEDSQTPNPKAPGTFYTNRPVLHPNGRQPQATNTPAPTSAAPGNAEIKNTLALKVIPMLEKLQHTVDALGDRLEYLLAKDATKQPDMQKYPPKVEAKSEEDEWSGIPF